MNGVIIPTRREILEENVFEIWASPKLLFDEIRIFFVVGFGRFESEVSVESIHHEVVWKVATKETSSILLFKTFQKLLTGFPGQIPFGRMLSWIQT